MVAGWVLDRLPTIWGGVAFFAAGLAGTVMIAVQAGPAFTVAGLMLVGIGLGAELSIGSYFITRLFGLKAFGQIFGWMNFGMSIAMAIGPYLMGAAYDRWGDYNVALIAATLSIIGSTTLASLLGRYRFTTDGEEIGETGSGDAQVSDELFVPAK